MLFNSFEFLFIFLPVVLGLFYLCRAYQQHTASRYLLVIACLFFYSYWHWQYLFLLLLSIGVNFAAGQRLADKPSKPLLIAGITFNLGLLIYYKYAGFFLDSINGTLSTQFTLVNIALPLAISFYTFQQIAYLVDSYKGLIARTSLVDYSLFVAFFPQLIAGPIVHYRQVMPQFKNLFSGAPVAIGYFGSGLFLLAVGLTKKVVIADTLAQYVDPVYANVAQIQIMDAWTAALAYTFQLYFDFSGYCDMAMGLALMFGIRLPINFNSPYKAANISDFWRRWHITLGNFIRDYLYIPMGGNRHGIIRQCAVLMTVMLLGGLWHGAGWNFILWGGLHGLYLVIYFTWRRTNVALPNGVAWFITFMAVLFAWVLFRAESVNDAVTVWKTMLGLNGIVLPSYYAVGLKDVGDFIYGHSLFISGLEIFAILCLINVVTGYRNSVELSADLKPTFKLRALTIAGLCASFVMLGQPSAFLYFNF